MKMIKFGVFVIMMFSSLPAFAETNIYFYQKEIPRTFQMVSTNMSEETVRDETFLCFLLRRDGDNLPSNDPRGFCEKAVKEIKEYKIQQLALKKPPSIGMSAIEARWSTWGSPRSIRKTTTIYGITEQWVYKDNRFLYFRNGKLEAISE
jgi:hypothetical protein